MLSIWQEMLQLYIKRAFIMILFSGDGKGRNGDIKIEGLMDILFVRLTKFSIFALVPRGRHIDESVFAFILCWESRKFQRTRKSNSFITCMAMIPFGIHHTGVGYCLFVQGFARAPNKINEIASHFSMLHINNHSWGGVEY